MLVLCFSMGQQLSLTRRNRRKTHKLFNSQFFMNGNNTLSHTFAVFDDEPIIELINVNSASENELLKVPEIDLELSKNITKHRRTIGYYQRVEDLVVVPGMGAERLEQIRPRVCTNSKNVMRSSSQSFDSLRTVDSQITITKSNKLVNVNKASIFDLQLVHGITQEVAASIVYYRNKKGPFKRIEDLRKIRNIDYIRLDNISRYLTVQDDEDYIVSEPTENLACDATNGCLRMNGGPLRYSSTNGMPATALADIFELLSIYSPRPIVNEIFRHSRNEQPAFRISSWNLEDFSVEKASNLGVKEVVCRTILENGWSIVSMQNVESEDSLKMICEELNKPKLHRVQEWRNNSHHWKYSTLDSENMNLGFIYDARGEDNTKLTSSEKGSPELDAFCDSMLASFEIENTKVQILNIKVKHQLNLPEVQYHLQKLINSEDNYLICGDFGILLSNVDILTDLEDAKLVLPMNLLNHSNLRTNFAKHCTSNFLLNTKFQKHLTGLHGVVRQGLTHLAIPLGWSWGGPISSHSPIWAEFFVNSERNL